MTPRYVVNGLCPCRKVSGLSPSFVQLRSYRRACDNLFKKWRHLPVSGLEMNSWSKTINIAWIHSEENCFWTADSEMHQFTARSSGPFWIKAVENNISKECRGTRRLVPQRSYVETWQEFGRIRGDVLIQPSSVRRTQRSGEKHAPSSLHYLCTSRVQTIPSQFELFWSVIPDLESDGTKALKSFQWATHGF